MKVLILSNAAMRCGIAEYGRELAYSLAEILSPANVTLCNYLREQELLGGSEVMVVNWHNNVVDVPPSYIKKVQETRKKVAVVLHNSWEGIEIGDESKDILAVADLVIAHEPMQFRPSPKRFAFIKMGAWEPGVKKKVEVNWSAIGTAGFQTPWKRFDVVQKAAADTGSAILVDWGPKERVIETLSMCGLNIFWHQPDTLGTQLGQSASVMMGVAAGRPIIISRSRKFRVLLDEYADEFYVAETEEDVYRLVREIQTTRPEKLRYPVRCMKEMSWSVVAKEYCRVLESLVNEPFCYN